MVQRGKKLLSLLLTAAMVASLVVVPAFAAPDTTGTTNEPQNVQDTSGNGEEGGSGGTNQEADANRAASDATTTGAVEITGDALLALDTDNDSVITLDRNYTLTSIVRVSGNNVTEINGNGHSITRSSEFARTQDQARGGYHGAMFEVNGSLTLNNVTLDDNNVVGGGKDDQKITNPVFASNNGKTGVENYVQDGMISCYDGAGTITLGSGTVLKNFGGMSAVHITGKGSMLTMESGSSIEGGGTTSKRENGGTGAAGAVWIQGGTFTMETGSTISGTKGHAVYADCDNRNVGATVTLNGTINNITAAKDLFVNGQQGAVVHLRGGSNGTIGGTISNVTSAKGVSAIHVIGNGRGTPVTISSDISGVENGIVLNVEDTAASATVSGTIYGSNCVVFNVTKGAKVNVSGSINTITGQIAYLRDGSGIEKAGDALHTEFVMDRDSKISGVTYSNNYNDDQYTQGLIDAQVSRGSKLSAGSEGIEEPNGDRVDFELNGEITDCNGGDIVWINSDIHADTTAGHVLGGYVTLTIRDTANIHNNTVSHIVNGQGGKHVISGKIHDNTVNNVFRKAFNCGPAYFVLEDGTEIYHNTIKGDANTWDGGSVINLGFSRMDMNDGSKIYGNISETGKAASVVVASGGELVMNGGTISDNIDIGVAYASGNTWGSDSWTNFGTTPNSVSGSLMIFAGGVPFVNPEITEVNHENGERCFTMPAKEIVPGADSVYFVTDAKTVQVVPGTKLGNASYNKDSKGNETGSVAGLNTAAKTYGLKDAFATFWAQSANGTPVSVKMDDPAGDEAAKFDATKPVYVLTQATDEKGAPVTNAEFTLLPATVKDGSVSFNLSDTGVNGCAVALVQPAEANGTLTLNTDVTELIEGQSYQVPYTVTFTPAGAEQAVQSVTVKFISPLTGPESVALEKNEETGTWTGTWTGTLTEADFKPGESIVTGAVANINAGAAETKPVYADGVSILMKALNTYTVTFDSNGGSTVANQSVQHGQLATQPAAPTRSGYTFNGWTLNGSAYDFTAPVTENITLVAQWTQNSGGGGTGGGGGGGGGGIDIPDDPTPLGGDLQLNREDHFAYVSGYPDSSVQPGGHITREEVATIFYRLLTEQSKAIYGVTTNNFNDVEAERWSNEAISTLANAQVLQGYADGGFHPGDPITRAEFTAIVTRFDEVDSAPASPFSDTAGHWAEDVIAFAASKNWVGGYPDGSFRPQSDITRAEAMTMINNILDRLVDEEGILAEARQWPDNAKDAWYYYAVQEATNSHDYTRRSADGIVENWTALR